MVSNLKQTSLVSCEGCHPCVHLHPAQAFCCLLKLLETLHTAPCQVRLGEHIEGLPQAAEKALFGLALAASKQLEAVRVQALRLSVVLCR